MTTLFDTSPLFTLSGDQPYRKKEFVPIPAKARLLDTKKADVDELYERMVKR